MQDKTLHTWVNWDRDGITSALDLNQGVLSLTGDTISFSLENGEKIFTLKLDEVKEFNFLYHVSGWFTWYIILYKDPGVNLRFSPVQGKNHAIKNNTYKEWLDTLEEHGVHTYSNRRDSVLMFSLSLGVVLIAVILLFVTRK